MNKPIQVTESSNIISQDSPGMANKGRGEEGGDSFASIITRSTSDAGNTENGQKLQASGKNLPEQQSGADDQQYAGDARPSVQEPTVASVVPVVAEEPLPDVVMNLPEHMAEQPPLQQVLVPEVLAIDEAGTATPESVAEQLVIAAEQDPAMTAGSQPEGQIPDQRILAEADPGNLAVANTSGPQDSIPDTGAVSMQAVAAHLTAASDGRIASGTEPVANAQREVVQQTNVNQAPGRDLQQFLRQNSNPQTASNLLPVSDGAEVSAALFPQALSDNALQMPSARVAVPVGQPGWGQALGTQVAWFVSRNINTASLRLNPQHLGPMEVDISLDGDKASVTFASHQGVVRDALESAIPRLREMLSANGLDLVSVNVSQQGMTRQNGEGTPDSRDGEAVAQVEGGNNEDLSGPGALHSAMLGQGLVDFYA